MPTLPLKDKGIHVIPQASTVWMCQKEVIIKMQLLNKCPISHF